MNLTDIIALAKQGYKPGDIKELIELADSIAPETTTQPTLSNTATEDEAVNTLAAPEKPKDESIVTPDTKVIDYKKLYEESQAKLADAQKANLNQNIQGETKSDYDIVMEWARS